MPASWRPPGSDPGLDPTTAAKLRKELERYLARRTGDSELARDLAQEAFVHLLRGLPRYRGTAGLGTWARRIALNVWRDHMRRTAVRPEGHAEVSVAVLLDALEPSAPDGAERAHERHVTHACLLEATRRLPLDARRVLLLHDFGDMPLAKVATALGCSTPTARVRLHRARKRLGELCRRDCTCESGGEDSPVCAPKRPTSKTRRT